MKVVWTDQAAKCLRELETFVARHDRRAAARLIDRLIDRGDGLTVHPDIGRCLPEMPGSGLRELVDGHYRIVYRRTAEIVEVLTVFEGHRRLRQDELDGSE